MTNRIFLFFVILTLTTSLGTYAESQPPIFDRAVSNKDDETADRWLVGRQFDGVRRSYDSKDAGSGHFQPFSAVQGNKSGRKASADQSGVIDGPTQITRSGEFIVVVSFHAEAGPAIAIFESDVTVDLGNHTVWVSDPTTPVIYIAPGVTNVIIKNGRLAGGSNGVLYDSTSSGTRVSVLSVEIIEPANEGVRVDRAEHFEILNCRFVGGSAGIAVNLNQSTSFGGRIEGNDISDTRGSGILVFNLEAGVVANNTVRRACSAGGGFGIALDGSSGNPGGNLVRNNRVSSGQGTSCDGIYVSAYSANNVIDHNVLSRNSGNGMNVQNGNLLVENVTSNNHQNGLVVGNRCLVSSHISNSNDLDGVRVTGVHSIIDSCVSAGNSDFGINFITTQYAGRDNTYRNNMLGANAAGPLGGDLSANNDGGGNY